LPTLATVSSLPLTPVTRVTTVPLSRDHLYVACTGRICGASPEPRSGSGPLSVSVFEPVLLYYPHNLFMETLISLGLVGATILVVHLAISLRATIWLLRRPDTPPYVVFIAISFVKDLIQAQFSGAVYTNTTVWVASACTIALYSAYRRDVRRRKLAVRMAEAMPVQASAWDPEDLVYENLSRAPR